MRRASPLGLALLCLLAAGLLSPWTLSATRAQDGPDEGVLIERVRLPRGPTAPAGDRILTIVRVDLRRYRVAVLSSVRDGEPRTLEQWVVDHHLTGGVNAGMFLPNRRPVATLIDRGEVLSDRNPARFDAIVGWDPRGASSPITVGGRGCRAQRRAILARYQSAVQGFRMMIDCQGRAMDWPTHRRYSAAAFGADDRGRAIFLHTRTPYPMAVLNEMIAGMSLGVRGLVYMEGGPEASLVVRDGQRSLTEIGSWEDGFNENDDNHRLWEIPSVIGFRPR